MKKPSITTTELLTLICLLMYISLNAQEKNILFEKKRWKGQVVCPIHPRSFKDSNGDGNGDLIYGNSKEIAYARTGKKHTYLIVSNMSGDKVNFELNPKFKKSRISHRKSIG